MAAAAAESPTKTSLTNFSEPQPFRLFDLPQELRDEIYKIHFSSTRLAHGVRHRRRECRPQVMVDEFIKPAPNSLALLRTCKQINAEVGDTWLNQVTFAFEEMGTMMDKLSALPLTKLSAVRHLRVSNREECRYYRGSFTNGELHILNRASMDFASMCGILSHLLTLNLETLTILGDITTGANKSYHIIDHIIRSCIGWKQLRYVHLSSGILEWKSPELTWTQVLRPRAVQPMDWQRVLEEKDGIDSVPLVTIDRALVPGTSVLRATETENIIQTAADDPARAIEPYRNYEDAFLRPDGYNEKQLLVVARRGRKTIQRRENELASLSEMDPDYFKQFWEKRKTKRNAMLPWGEEDEPEGPWWPVEGVELFDSYEHVDDYTPEHFGIYEDLP